MLRICALVAFPLAAGSLKGVWHQTLGDLEVPAPPAGESEVPDEAVVSAKRSGKKQAEAESGPVRERPISQRKKRGKGWGHKKWSANQERKKFAKAKSIDNVMDEDVC